ncbi:MAG: 4-hydroxybutyryl-CoA dehydratase, partial [Spirochaetes bacterium]|nr:4-hydroxybutyryl-CoA dehydratase [Spirochaetota bacterium]
MPLKTPSDYIESIRSLNRIIYMFGQKIDNTVDHPIIKPSLNAVAMTYALAQKDEYNDIMTAKSHITGNIINRFTHIHQSIDDLVKKSKMGRLLGSQTGCCFQRCVGMDALNALSMTTYAIDKTYNTTYYQRFLQYLEYVQNNDLVCDGAMTDPKGDRSLPPHKQDDPDLYLRVVKELKDGIIVRGAKAHQTGAINSHEIIVMPTIAMREEDKDWAVAFAVPADTPGIIYIYGRQSCDTRKLEKYTIDQGNALFGG